jgi:hypothetical protein
MMSDPAARLVIHPYLIADDLLATLEFAHLATPSI